MPQDIPYYNIVVSIFFSMIPIYPQYIPYYTIVLGLTTKKDATHVWTQAPGRCYGSAGTCRDPKFWRASRAYGVLGLPRYRV